MRTYLIQSHDADGTELQPWTAVAENDGEFDEIIRPMLLASPAYRFDVIGDGGDGGFSRATYRAAGVRAHG